MAITANIEKKIYLNNKLWTTVNTTTITGSPLHRWGPVPSVVSFRVNRHFDSVRTDTGSDFTTPIKHQDNIKLFIAPVSAAVEWPEEYTGNNFGGPGHGPIDQYLAWQGVYVDPNLGFTINDTSMSYEEEYSVTCYDYRWALNKCLARISSMGKYVWSSGEYSPSGDDDDEEEERIRTGWNDVTNEGVGYEFMYNDFIPRCKDADPKSWVEIVEHMLRQVIVSVGPYDNGTIDKHIRDYGTMCEISFAGLRLGADMTEKIYSPYLEDDYYDIDIDPPAEADKRYRSFAPDPIEISNDFLLNAVQRVLDSVGNIRMYMDQWCVVHFMRVRGPAEPELDIDGLNSTAVNAAGELYLCHFADTGVDVSGFTPPIHNVRGIDSLVPRAIPEANRVIGQLSGRDAVTHDIVNSGTYDEDAGYTGMSAFHWCGDIDESDLDDFKPDPKEVPAIAYKEYHRRTNKIYGAYGKIRKPTKPVPYLYAYEVASKRILTNNPVPGITLADGQLNHATGGGGAAIETQIKDNNRGRTMVYRYGVSFVTGPAAVSAVDSKADLDASDPLSTKGGGNYIRLNEPMWTVVKLQAIEWSKLSDANKKRYEVSSQHVFITHSWGARGRSSNQQVGFATNTDAGDEDSICLHGMGVAPSAEIYSIDSSYHEADDGSVPKNDWSKAGRYDTEDLRDYVGEVMTFPGLGEYDATVIDAPVIQKRVDDFMPNNDETDALSWSQKWEKAKAGLKRLVKIEALRMRQLITTGTLPVLYDPDLLLKHRVCVLGTRDDSDSTEYAMRLRTMRSHISQINLTTNDELELVLTDQLALPQFSVFEYLSRF